MKVRKVLPDAVELMTAQGKTIRIAQNVLEEDSYSADHFEKEIKCTMTELSGILQGARDSVFKVQFQTKVDEKLIQQRLAGLTKAQIGQPTEVAKAITVGETVALVGHLVKSEQHLGRTLIIDLASNGYRQVDHRTIQWIILRNVKYSLGKQYKKPTPSPADAASVQATSQARWDLSQL